MASVQCNNNEALTIWMGNKCVIVAGVVRMAETAAYSCNYTFLYIRNMVSFTWIQHEYAKCEY